MDSEPSGRSLRPRVQYFLKLEPHLAFPVKWAKNYYFFLKHAYVTSLVSLNLKKNPRGVFQFTFCFDFYCLLTITLFLVISFSNVISLQSKLVLLREIFCLINTNLHICNDRICVGFIFNPVKTFLFTLFSNLPSYSLSPPGISMHLSLQCPTAQL